MSNNIVYRGRYTDKAIVSPLGNTQIVLSIFGTKKVYLDKYNVRKYEIVNKIKKMDKESALWRGLIGSWVAGSKGALYGASRGKKTYDYEVHIIFVDNSECLARMDDKIFNDFKENMSMPLRDPSSQKDQLSSD